jgi:hypothetical protein
MIITIVLICSLTSFLTLPFPSFLSIAFVGWVFNTPEFRGNYVLRVLIRVIWKCVDEGWESCP